MMGWEIDYPWAGIERVESPEPEKSLLVPWLRLGTMATIAQLVPRRHARAACASRGRFFDKTKKRQGE